MLKSPRQVRDCKGYNDKWLKRKCLESIVVLGAVKAMPKLWLTTGAAEYAVQRQWIKKGRIVRNSFNKKRNERVQVRRESVESASIIRGQACYSISSDVVKWDMKIRYDVLGPGAPSC